MSAEIQLKVPPGIAVEVTSTVPPSATMVPGRLSGTGWDDLLLARKGTPSLSTVAVDRETAGRHAMRRLIAAP